MSRLPSLVLGGLLLASPAAAQDVGVTLTNDELTFFDTLTHAPIATVQPPPQTPFSWWLGDAAVSADGTLAYVSRQNGEILVYDLTQSDSQPHAVLTGDTLFIGDVGRPDLLASIGVTADELADMLYESVNRLKELPDETLVYPAHGAGSMCGKALSSETVSTIGEQKQSNPFLRVTTLDQFLGFMGVPG